MRRITQHGEDNTMPHLARIDAEKRLLRSQFGSEYEAFCARSSRLIPRVSIKRSFFEGRAAPPRIFPCIGTSPPLLIWPAGGSTSTPTAEDDWARRGFEREPDLRRKAAPTTAISAV